MTAIHPVPTSEQEAALEVLRGAECVLLVGHMRPDGDCVGSQAALACVLRALGKRVFILNPDAPAAVFDRLVRECPFETFLGGAIPEHDLCVLLDINDLSRCGAMERLLAEYPSTKMVVDHHMPSGEVWWDAGFIDVTASATGLLVARIASALDVPFDLIAAEGIFTALVADTGWFKYSNTDAETMALAAELVRAGVQPSELYGRLYQRHPRHQPQSIAQVLGGLEYFCNGRLGVIEHPLESRGGSPLTDPDPVLDIVRAVGEVEVVLYVRELEDGMCKLSARSKTDYDVNALARKFGGGGHKKASGATIEGTLSEVRARLVDAATRQMESRDRARSRKRMTAAKHAPIEGRDEGQDEGQDAGQRMERRR